MLYISKNHSLILTYKVRATDFKEIILVMDKISVHIIWIYFEEILSYFRFAQCLFNSWGNRWGSGLGCKFYYDIFDEHYEKSKYPLKRKKLPAVSSHWEEKKHHYFV